MCLPGRFHTCLLWLKSIRDILKSAYRHSLAGVVSSVFTIAVGGIYGPMGGSYGRKASNSASMEVLLEGRLELLFQEGRRLEIVV